MESLFVRLDEADLHGVANEAGDVIDPEAFHQLSTMRVRGLGADVKPVGDRLGGQTLGDQFQDFALAGGERIRSSMREEAI